MAPLQVRPVHDVVPPVCQVVAHHQEVLEDLRHLMGTFPRRVSLLPVPKEVPDEPASGVCPVVGRREGADRRRWFPGVPGPVPVALLLQSERIGVEGLQVPGRGSGERVVLPGRVDEFLHALQEPVRGPDRRPLLVV